MTRPLLSARTVSAGYHGLPVVHDCDVQVPEGSMVGIVGRNGAGKSTLVSALSGRLRLLAGTIHLLGQDISTMAAYRRSRAGIVHVPQGREVFDGLSVEENLRVADRGGDRRIVGELFPVLDERARQRAGTLSGGEQQMLAIARAILARPRIIMLDEPSLGLAPLVVQRLFDSIASLRRETGITMLLVEQQTRWMWQSGQVDYVYVLEQGQVAAEGTPRDLGEGVVTASYLGRQED